MTRVIVRYFFTSTIFYFSLVLTFGQTKTATSESLVNVSDSLLKSEIASFTKKGASLKLKDSLPKAQLIEIPIRNCSDKEVHLSRSTFFSSVSTFIHIYLKEELSLKKLDSIVLITHSHFLVKFPGDAYKDIFTSAQCKLAGGKRGKLFSDYYKAFYSQDRRRLYIYMIGGTDINKYEVTWVVIDDRFFTRVLDNIN